MVGSWKVRDEPRERWKQPGGTGGTAERAPTGRPVLSPPGSQEAAEGLRDPCKHWAGQETRPKAVRSPQRHLNLLASKNERLLKGGTEISARMVPTVIYFPFVHKELRRTSLCAHNTKRKALHSLTIAMFISLLKIKANECQEDTEVQ